MRPLSLLVAGLIFAAVPSISAAQDRPTPPRRPNQPPQAQPDRPQRPDARPERPERPQPPQRPETRPERPERPQPPQRPDTRPERPERPERPQPPQRPDTRPEQRERPERHPAMKAAIEFIRRMDTNRDHKISRDEWRGPHRAFDKFDRNGSGFLEGPELRHLARELAEHRNNAIRPNPAPSRELPPATDRNN